MNSKKHGEMKEEYQRGHSKICPEMVNLESRLLKSKLRKTRNFILNLLKLHISAFIFVLTKEGRDKE